MTDEPLAILKGALDVLILRALSWGPMHGYGVSYWIRRVTDNAFDLQEGVLYPALHRLERKGWIESEWGVSENNRRAKYYELTALGRKQLRRELSTWARSYLIVCTLHCPRAGGAKQLRFHPNREKLRV